MSAFPVNGPSSFALRGRAYQAEAFEDASPPARSRRRWPLAAAVLVLLALAAWQLGGAAWIHAKATLAQHLIASAWEGTKKDGARRPWPWADTRPVARLTVPSRGISLYVLAGTSGRSLAFGPGHVGGTALPGSAGNSVIVAHRDTHFAFLRELVAGDLLWLDTPRTRIAYVVEGTAVVDARRARLATAGTGARLVLVTCWPFDAVEANGPWRYVVEARLAGATTPPVAGAYLQ